MRRIVLAPSFDREVEAIGVAIEQRFGEQARHNFVADLARICTLIAVLPRMGTTRHGYDTKLWGSSLIRIGFSLISTMKRFISCI